MDFIMFVPLMIVFAFFFFIIFILFYYYHYIGNCLFSTWPLSSKHTETLRPTVTRQSDVEH